MEDDGGPVRIVQERPPDHTLEDRLAGGKLVLERGERGLEGQALDWIRAVQPARQGLEHHRQSARKAAGVVLAQAKLDRVQRGVDLVALDAALEIGRAS